MEPHTVTRSIDLDVATDDVWHLLADAERWPAWLGTAEGVDVRPGGAGTVLEPDGTRRRLVMERVDEGQRLAWRWWPESSGDGGAVRASPVSTVELVVVPAGAGGSRLTVTESFPAGVAFASVESSARAAPGGRRGERAEAAIIMSPAWGWDLRLMHLGVLVLLASTAAHLVR